MNRIPLSKEEGEELSEGLSSGKNKGNYEHMKLPMNTNTLVCIKCRICDRDLGEMKQGPGNKGSLEINRNLLRVNF